MTTPFPMWVAPTVPIVGSTDVFPVRHVYCVGRIGYPLATKNYHHEIVG